LRKESSKNTTGMIGALLSAWRAEVINGLRWGTRRWSLIAGWAGVFFLSFVLYKAAGSALRYAVSVLDSELALRLELTFINLFMAVGLIMLLRGLIDGTFRHCYESSDLPILIKSPAPPHLIFAHKMARVIGANLFGLLFWLLPPWLAMAGLFHPGPLFFILLLPILFALLVLTEASVALISLPLVYLLYSRRMTRSIGRIASFLFILLISFLAASYFGTTEADRGRFFVWLGRHIGSLVSWRWYPHVWASNLLMSLSGLKTVGSRWGYAISLFCTAVGLTGSAVAISGWLYYPGWERSRTAELSGRTRKRNGLNLDLGFLLKGPAHALAFKDLIQTIRDPRYWQISIILLLIPVITLVVLAGRDMPMGEKVIMLTAQQLIYGMMLSLNLCWAGFKSEGRTWWILRSSPITPQTFFKAKLAVSSLPPLLYVELFTLMGLLVLRAPLKWWPILAFSVGFATFTFASMNTAVGSLPSVILSGDGRSTSTLASGVMMFLDIGITVGAVIAIALSQGHGIALPLVSAGLMFLFAGLFIGSLRLGWRNAERLIEPQS